MRELHPARENLICHVRIFCSDSVHAKEGPSVRAGEHQVRRSRAVHGRGPLNAIAESYWRGGQVRRLSRSRWVLSTCVALQSAAEVRVGMRMRTLSSVAGTRIILSSRGPFEVDPTLRQFFTRDLRSDDGLQRSSVRLSESGSRGQHCTRSSVGPRHDPVTSPERAMIDDRAALLSRGTKDSGGWWRAVVLARIAQKTGLSSPSVSPVRASPLWLACIIEASGPLHGGQDRSGHALTPSADRQQGPRQWTQPPTQLA